MIYFYNDGCFDFESMVTFGISAKDNDSAIGYFGTGFKYAVAIILRLGGKISVKSEGEEYIFTIQNKKVRNEEFDLVVVRNGGEETRTGFTTRLGINWDPWMAFRELYCNALDEKGNVSQEFPEGKATIISVDCSSVEECLKSMDEYFIYDRYPIYEGHKLDVYDGRSRVFYKGVLVGGLEGSKFDYNIKEKILLTEERLIKDMHEVDFAISWEISKSCRNEKIIKEFVIDSDSYESKVGIQQYAEPSHYVQWVCNKLINTTGISLKTRKILKEYKIIPEEFEKFNLSSLQSKQIEKAKTFLKGIGFNVAEFAVKFAQLDEGVLGQAYNDTIYVSPLAFQLGTKQVASTLLEEYIHLKLGCRDFDRKMQNFLFDKVISLGEELTGEPV